MTVDVSRDGGVLRLHLNAPDKRNAIGDEMMTTLIDEIDAAGRDESVRVIVLSGEGEHFCSGADFVTRNVAGGQRPRVGSIQRRLPAQANRLVPLVATTQTPIVVRAHGWTAGIGLNLALAADICVAADDARMWTPFVERGFTPDSGATWLLPRRVGEVRSRRMLLLGEVVSGTTAEKWGMVHRAVPLAELDTAVDEVVAHLASGATVALGLTKWLLHSGSTQSFDQHLRDEAFALELSSRSEDFKEGFAAFREHGPRVRRSVTVAEVLDPAVVDTTTLAMPDGAPLDVAVPAVRTWIEANVPVGWRDAAARGGTQAIRQVRSRAAYAEWYPVFGRSGLVASNWDVAYGGLGLAPDVAHAVDAELAPFNLGRLNPLGLNNTAAALFSHGTEGQRRRFLPPIVRNEEKWCQLFSEPGAGSDLASLACRGERDGDEWILNGQKVWTTWGFDADFGILLARTDPDVGKRKGITYFLVDLHQPGVDVRDLRHITGEVDFCEVFLDDARVPDSYRVGAPGDGWRVAASTLAGERQMVAGAGSGGVGRIGGSGAASVIALARRISAEGRPGGWDDPVVRDELVRLYAEEQCRAWTNLRVRASLKAGRAPGPESSIGKVHQGSLNQRLQAAAAGLLGASAMAWEWAGTPSAGGLGPESYDASLPHEVRGMLRSRANTIEGGTTEVNKNILGERVLGLPREPDPFRDAAWRDIPRS